MSGHSSSFLNVSGATNEEDLDENQGCSASDSAEGDEMFDMNVNNGNFRGDEVEDALDNDMGTRSNCVDPDDEDDDDEDEEDDEDDDDEVGHRAFQSPIGSMQPRAQDADESNLPCPSGLVELGEHHAGLHPRQAHNEEDMVAFPTGVLLDQTELWHRPNLDLQMTPTDLRCPPDWCLNPVPSQSHSDVKVSLHQGSEVELGGVNGSLRRPDDLGLHGSSVHLGLHNQVNCSSNASASMSSPCPLDGEAKSETTVHAWRLAHQQPQLRRWLPEHEDAGKTDNVDHSWPLASKAEWGNQMQTLHQGLDPHHGAQHEVQLQPQTHWLAAGTMDRPSAEASNLMAWPKDLDPENVYQPNGQLMEGARVLTFPQSQDPISSDGGMTYADMTNVSKQWAVRGAMAANHPVDKLGQFEARGNRMQQPNHYLAQMASPFHNSIHAHGDGSWSDPVVSLRTTAPSNLLPTDGNSNNCNVGMSFVPTPPPHRYKTSEPPLKSAKGVILGGGGESHQCEGNAVGRLRHKDGMERVCSTLSQVRQKSHPYRLKEEVRTSTDTQNYTSTNLHTLKASHIVSWYIDYLIHENEHLTQISRAFSLPVNLFHSDDFYFMESLKKSVHFPSLKFLTWMRQNLPTINVNAVDFNEGRESSSRPASSSSSTSSSTSSKDCKPKISTLSAHGKVGCKVGGDGGPPHGLAKVSSVASTVAGTPGGSAWAQDDWVWQNKTRRDIIHDVFFYFQHRRVSCNN